MMNIVTPGTSDYQSAHQEGDMIASMKNETLTVLNKEYQHATVSTNDPIIEQYMQETRVCKQGTLWGAYKENGVIRNNTPRKAALHDPKTGERISAVYHSMYSLGNVFIGIKVETDSQGVLKEGSQTYFLVTPDGREGKQFLGRVDAVTGYTLAREFCGNSQDSLCNLYSRDNLDTPLQKNVTQDTFSDASLHREYSQYQIPKTGQSPNQHIFPKEKIYTVQSDSADRYTIVDAQGTVIYDIPRNNWAPQCRLAYNANDTRVEINQGTQSIAIHIPSSKKIISDYGMNMHIKVKFLIDFINNYDCIVYDADGVKLPGFGKLYDNEYRMIALKNDNKLHFLDTMTGEYIPQEFDTYLRKYTNNDGSMTYIVENNHELIAVTVY